MNRHSRAAVIASALLAACGTEQAATDDVIFNAAEPAGNAAEPISTAPAELPAEPSEDPSLASLSPSQRREYDRGYRDCLAGRYRYDAERQGESYRIGCMTAENRKGSSAR